MSSTLLRIGLWVVLIVIVLYVLQQTFEEGPVAEYVGTPMLQKETSAVTGCRLAGGLHTCRK